MPNETSESLRLKTTLKLQKKCHFRSYIKINVTFCLQHWRTTRIKWVKREDKMEGVHQDADSCLWIWAAKAQSFFDMTQCFLSLTNAPQTHGSRASFLFLLCIHALNAIVFPQIKPPTLLCNCSSTFYHSVHKPSSFSTTVFCFEIWEHSYDCTVLLLMNEPIESLCTTMSILYSSILLLWRRSILLST